MDSGLLDEFMSEATNLSTDGDQRMLNQKDGVTVLAKKVLSCGWCGADLCDQQVPGIQHAMIKASCEIPASAHTVYHTLCDLEARRSWDQAAESFEIVEQLDTNRAVCYTRIAVAPQCAAAV